MKRFFKIFLVCAMMLLLAMTVTGCADAVDINKKLIATTIVVDKKDGEIWFYIEIANVQASQGGQASSGNAGDKFIYVKAHGKTLVEARQNLDRQLDRPLFLSSVRTLLLTENFAGDDLVEYLFRLRADETYRKKVITITTRDDPEEMLKALHELNESIGFSIEHTIMSLDDLGESFSRSTSRLLENLSADYTGILIPCVGLQNKEIALVGYSVVNGTKVIGFIPIEDSKGLIQFKADKAKDHYIVPYKEFQFTIETALQKRQVEASYTEGQIHFAVKMSVEAKVQYGDKKTPYHLEDANVKEISATLKDMMEKELLIAIDQAQQVYKTDYLQMDDTFRIKYPVLFETMDWQNAFLTAEISVDVKVDLNATQMMDYGSYEIR